MARRVRFGAITAVCCVAVVPVLLGVPARVAADGTALESAAPPASVTVVTAMPPPVTDDDEPTPPRSEDGSPITVSSDPTSQARGVTNGLVTAGIPAVAMRAYVSAADAVRGSDPRCGLDWALLAAIGRIESDHGRHGGSALDGDGIARGPIYGPTLTKISDTDGGRLDGDGRYDRAVGPMQFIPGTWQAYGADGDDDGVADPQNIYDAALAAGHYLCAGGSDLEADPGAAVFRYNHSAAYVAEVLALAEAYRSGLSSALIEPRDAGGSGGSSGSGGDSSSGGSGSGGSGSGSGSGGESGGDSSGGGSGSGGSGGESGGDSSGGGSGGGSEPGTPSPSASSPTSPSPTQSSSKPPSSATPTKDPTPTASKTPSPSPTKSPSPTDSPSPTPTPCPSPTASPSPSPSPSPTDCGSTSQGRALSAALMADQSPSPTPSETPCASQSPSPSPSETPSPTPTGSCTPTPCPTASPSPSPSPTPTGCPTTSPTPTTSPSPTPSPTDSSPSPSPSPTPTTEPSDPTPSPSSPGPTETGGSGGGSSDDGDDATDGPSLQPSQTGGLGPGSPADDPVPPPLVAPDPTAGQLTPLAAVAVRACEPDTLGIRPPPLRDPLGWPAVPGAISGVTTAATYQAREWNESSAVRLEPPRSRVASVTTSVLSHARSPPTGRPAERSPPA